MKSVLQRIQPFFDLCKQLFVFALILYLVLFILETILPGFVSYNFDLNKVLLVVFIFGLLSVFAREEKEQNKKEEVRKFTKKDFIFLGVLGLVIGIVVFTKSDTDMMTKIVSGFLGGFVVSLTAWILLFVNDEDEGDTL